MKKYYLQWIISIGMAIYWAETATAQPVPPPPPAPPACNEKVTRPVKLYFTDINPTVPADVSFAKILAEIKNSAGLMNVTIAQNEKTIFLHGCEKEVEEMARAIASLDVPRSSINLEMWRLQLSSNNSEELGKVVFEINQEIAKTQQLMQKTYAALEEGAKGVEVDPALKILLEEKLGYSSALDENRNLSMTDILLRINAAKDPVGNATSMTKFMRKVFEAPEYASYINKNKQNEPFKRYLARIGVPEKCFYVCTTTYNRRVWTARQAMLDFALNYVDYIRKPNGFDPFRLQQATDGLDSFIKPVVDDINRDVADLFIEPTLQKIQAIVRNHRDVQYAQAGKTSAAGLDGFPIVVRSEAISNFAESNPIKLSEVADSTGGQLTLSNPKLIEALIKDRSQSRNITSGVSLTVTPNVLRNSTSADLTVSIAFGPSGADGKVTEAVSAITPGNPQEISRISQQYINTKISVNALDLFPISTFNTQSTKDGGRSTIPVVGTVWQGVFGSIPVLGDLFSWKNPPQNVAHQSILLTNSFITPTAMGLGILYQQYNNDDPKKCGAIQDYLKLPENQFYAQQRMKHEKYCDHFNKQ
jgi:hypothetical protein